MSDIQAIRELAAFYTRACDDYVVAVRVKDFGAVNENANKSINARHEMERNATRYIPALLARIDVLQAELAAMRGEG